MDRSRQSLELLAVAQAVLGGVIAAITLVVFFRQTDAARNGLTIVLASLGFVALLYYLSIHHWLKKRQAAVSTFILTAITSANLALLIIQTGGPDSAFYSFWLLVIVVFGVFGVEYIYLAAASSAVFFIIELIRGDSPHVVFFNHAGQLLATFFAAIIAHWAYARLNQASQNNQQAAARVGEEQLKAMALMNSITEGVMVIDNQRRIQLFNPAASELTGWDRSSAIGLEYNLVVKLKTGEDLDLDTSKDPFAEAWSQNKGVIKNNLALISKSGRRRSISMSVSPLFDFNRQSTGAIALFRDITGQTEIERQRSEFISTASHEMRTPIAALEGYIALALNPAVATVDQRARTYLEKAHTTIEHLGELFRDLLSAAKMEEGNVKEQILPVEIGEIIEEITDELQFTAQKKNVRLVYQASSIPARQTITPPYFVKANPERLREVITNLVDNAIKFTQAGSVTVALSGNNDFIRFSVKDTGAGIAPEDIPHLFQKFYRVDNSATRTTGGTGLGLYICRQIIERYSGRIWVESTPGQGSTFYFSLPRLRADQVAQTKPEPVEPPMAGVAQG